MLDKFSQWRFQNISPSIKWTPCFKFQDPYSDSIFSTDIPIRWLFLYYLIPSFDSDIWMSTSYYIIIYIHTYIYIYIHCMIFYMINIPMTGVSPHDESPHVGHWRFRWKCGPREKDVGLDHGGLPCPSAEKSRQGPPHCQWIGLRENLQETIDFPTKYGVFL